MRSFSAELKSLEVSINSQRFLSLVRPELSDSLFHLSQSSHAIEMPLC